MEAYRPYRKFDGATSDLEQGDVLSRTSFLVDDLLRTYHPYYAIKETNELFSVLTQSCDLVRRGGGKCASRYIALAPVRTLREVASREFELQLTRVPGGVSIGSYETKERYQEFLRRLFNNNNPKFFFLPQQPDLGVVEDMCVILPLAISVKVEHYDGLLAARRAQIDELYQAKLGWLLGQQFARVGTPDWPDEVLRAKAETSTLRAEPTWLPEREFLELRKALAAWELQNPGAELDEAGLQRMRKTLPSRIDEAIDAIFKVLISQSVLQEERGAIKPVLRKLLRSDPVFSSFVR